MAKNYELRRMCRNMYDLQKIRIQTYNRIISERYIEEMKGAFDDIVGDKMKKAGDDKEKIKKLRALCTESMIDEYNQVKDAIVNITRYAKKDQYIKDNCNRIRDYAIYGLINSYANLRNAEDEILNALKYQIKSHPIYAEFLSKIKGCGPVMSAVMLSEFDVHAARHVSSFWKYAGLDVVLRPVKLEDYKIELKPDKESIRKAGIVFDITFDVYGNIKDDLFDPDNMIIDEDDSEEMILEKQCLQIMEYIKDDTRLPIYGKARSNIKEHLIDVEYINKKGETDTKKSITYNPTLKSKLLGVLAPSLIVHGDTYRKIYDDYKYRITKENETREFKRTKAHIENMARRYMVKMLVKDLWNYWRKYEGYEVEGDWYEDKVLHRRHGENQSL